MTEIRAHDGLVAPLACFPGTHIYDDMVRAGTIDDDYWIREKKDTLYLMTGAPARRSFKRLVALCARAGRGAGYTRQELEAHKSLLPDSFATWLASAEAYERQGDAGAALMEYESIERFSPRNLWAMLRIGRLLQATGDADGAAYYFKEALAAAPGSRMIRDLAGEARPQRRRSRGRATA